MKGKNKAGLGSLWSYPGHFSHDSCGINLEQGHTSAFLVLKQEYSFKIKALLNRSV